MSETRRKTIQITESCGCVFCDVGLKPDEEINGWPAHLHPKRGTGYSFCTRDERLPPPPSEGD